MSPGPLVTAIKSKSDDLVAAFLRDNFKTGMIFFKCSLAAKLGTTPPHLA